jgi:hypothetical protein
MVNPQIRANPRNCQPSTRGVISYCYNLQLNEARKGQLYTFRVQSINRKGANVQSENLGDPPGRGTRVETVQVGVRFFFQKRASSRSGCGRGRWRGATRARRSRGGSLAARRRQTGKSLPLPPPPSTVAQQAASTVHPSLVASLDLGSSEGGRLGGMRHRMRFTRDLRRECLLVTHLHCGRHLRYATPGLFSAEEV